MSEMAASEEPERMYAAAFRARHDCVVGNASREYPNLQILQWCLNNREIFQIAGPADEREGLHAWIRSQFGVRHSSLLAASALIVTEACRCVPPGGSVSDVIESVGAWDIPPVVYQDGWEAWRVIAWDEGSIRRLFKEVRRLGEVEITSLRPIENARMEQMMLMPASDVFADITDRQLDALIMGLEHGYYSVPSETKVEYLAQGAGVAPSTFSEHLRKAETRVMRNLRPYLQAYATRAGGEVALGKLRP